MDNEFYTPSELSGVPAPDLGGQFKTAAMMGPPQPADLGSGRKFDLSMPPPPGPQENYSNVSVEVGAHSTSGAPKGNYAGLAVNVSNIKFLSR